MPIHNSPLKKKESDPKDSEETEESEEEQSIQDKLSVLFDSGVTTRASRRKLNQEQLEGTKQTYQEILEEASSEIPSSSTLIIAQPKHQLSRKEIAAKVSASAKKNESFYVDLNQTRKIERSPILTISPPVIIQDLKTGETFVSPARPPTSVSLSGEFNFQSLYETLTQSTLKTLKVESQLEVLLNKRNYIPRLSQSFEVQLRKYFSQSTPTSTTKGSTTEQTSITEYTTKPTVKRTLNYDSEDSESSDHTVNSKTEKRKPKHSPNQEYIPIDHQPPINSEDEHYDSDESIHLEYIPKEKMEFKPAALLNAIPTFDGKEKELDSFINVCKNLAKLLEGKDDKLKDLAVIIKTRIIGRGLARIEPVDELDTWPKIKDKLESVFKRPQTYELAQFELANTVQKPRESIEDYSERIQKALDNLNKATRTFVAQNEAAFPALQAANDKQALHYFEQNIFNADLRVRVDSANKSTLKEAILFAKQKEISLKLNITKICDFCKIPGHDVSECRKKNFNQQQTNANGLNFRSNDGQNLNRFNQQNSRNFGSGFNNNRNFGGGFNNTRFNTSGNNSGYNRFNNNNFGNNRFNNSSSGNAGFGNNNFGRNNDNNNNRGNFNQGNGGNRNETYYRDNRVQTTGNNSQNQNTNDRDQRNNYRTNFGNTGSTGNSNSQRQPTNQGSRGNVRMIQNSDEEIDYRGAHSVITSAQIHEKN